MVPTFLFEMDCSARQTEEAKLTEEVGRCVEIRRMLLGMERYVFTTKLNF